MARDLKAAIKKKYQASGGYNPFDQSVQPHNLSTNLDDILQQNEVKREKLAKQIKELPPELFDPSVFCPLTGTYCRRDCVMYRKEKPQGYRCGLTELSSIAYFLKKLEGKFREF